MTISYNWLKEYIQTDITAQRAAEILTAIGLEIESIEKVEKIKGGLSGLVVAQVLTCEKHPEADKLHITTVTTGDQTLQIVCGAPNVARGQKVILATVGTTLYPTPDDEGMKIKRSKIRGVESLGMLCAEDEIGLGTSHDGIMVLPADAIVGTPASELFDLGEEYIFEVGLTPNRVDASSHYGVARDLAAFLRIQATLPSVDQFKVDNESLPIKVTVQNPSSAPRYMGVTMSGIQIKPSPEWLQNRLRSIGIHPKNNVVDITNFVLHECGQPLHAFDLDKVEGGEIIVKNCDQDTPFTTLDSIERKLSSEDLMICSATRPMCLAGVFGGMDSGVSDTTNKIFIESAYFNPVTVRKSAKRHGLSTDASFRYERGTDPNIPPYALMRAAMLIKELAGGQITSQVTDLYPTPIQNFCFEVSYDNINRLIGKHIPEQTVDLILSGLQIKILSKTDGVLEVSVPPYRVDVQREADVIEEILRIYGFNNIENPHIIKNVITVGNRITTDRMTDTVSNMLVALGCTEIMSNSLTKATYYDTLTSYKAENCVRIVNPLSIDLNTMRQTLLFNALEAVQLNSNRKNSDLKLFEVGNCYFYDPSKADSTLRPYSQAKHLAITITGASSQATWQGKAQPSSFYTVKSLVEKIFDRLGLNFNEGTMETLESDLYSEAVSYKIRGSQLFEIGIISRKIRTIFDIKAAVYYMEMDVEKLQKLVNTVKVQARELSKFQPVKRDLALLVDKSTTFSTLREAASRAEKKLIKSITLFDVYEGNKLPEGKKSYALNFVIEDATKTLTDSDIERIMQTITKALEKAGATVRS